MLPLYLLHNLIVCVIVELRVNCLLIACLIVYLRG